MDVTDIILVTGSSGLMGQAALRRLAQDGCLHVLSPSHAELDLTDEAATQRYFLHHRPNHVIHLAAKVGGIAANRAEPASFLRDNTLMQLHVLEAARAAGVETLLLPGSACSYPKAARVPIAESSFLQGVPEETNLAYAIAKINGLVAAQSYVRQYGLRVVLPMPANCYGDDDHFDGDRSHVIPALIRRFHQAKQDGAAEVALWGTGAPVREFLHADDAVDAFLFLMRQENLASGEIVNVGTGQEIRIDALASLIAKETGYEGTVRFDPSHPDGVMKKTLDSSRIIGLGWKPSITLTQGIHRMVQHYLTRVSS
jgi:GDP-L-fucose synthase